MAIVGAVTCLCLVGLVDSLLMHHAGNQKLDENSPEQMIFLILSTHGSILAGAQIVMWLNGLDWGTAFGFTLRTTTRSILCGLLAAVVFLPLGRLLQWISLELLTRPDHPAPVQEAVKMLQATHNPVSLGLQVAFAVLIAPVAEEVLFRGVLYAGVKRLGFPKSALWGTALLFAAIHGNLPIFLPLLALAVALVGLYELTDNLLAPITAHSFFNAINLYGYFHSGGATQTVHGAFHWFGS